MKSTELATIIERLGQNIARYDHKAMQAFSARDFETSQRYHEKALAIEKRVQSYLNHVKSSNKMESQDSSKPFPTYMSC